MICRRQRTTGSRKTVCGYQPGNMTRAAAAKADFVILHHSGRRECCIASIMKMALQRCLHITGGNSFTPERPPRKIHIQTDDVELVRMLNCIIVTGLPGKCHGRKTCYRVNATTTRPLADEQATVELHPRDRVIISARHQPKQPAFPLAITTAPP